MGGTGFVLINASNDAKDKRSTESKRSTSQYIKYGVIGAVAFGVFATLALTTPQSLIATLRPQPERIAGATNTVPNNAGVHTITQSQSAKQESGYDAVRFRASAGETSEIHVGADAPPARIPSLHANDLTPTDLTAGGNNATDNSWSTDFTTQFAAVEEVAERDSGEGLSVEPTGPDYTPDSAQTRNLGTGGTVITVPVSQGRLLRFDDAVESVFIADPAIADVRVVAPDLVYVYGKQLGLTNLMAVSGGARQTNGNVTATQQLTASALLRVITDPRPALEAQDQWNLEAPINLRFFGRRVAASGHVNNVDQAVDVANITQTYSPADQPPLNKVTVGGSNQVNIRVRFAEVSRSDLKSFGIDWNVGVNAGNFGLNVGRAGRPTDHGGVGEDRSLGISADSGNFNIDLLIEALQANGAVNILAEPNLTAVTGETATFLAGGEVPIPVPSGSDGATTIQFKSFGVSLAFTPTIVKEGRIGMRVTPEVSSIAANQNFAVQGFNIPSFTVRRADTTVELASGQTFALAGLFQREWSRDIDKFPVLGDMPVLGELFRSERYQRNETELVILITPYLVEPVSDRKLATPLDRVGPSPWEADVTAKGSGHTEPQQPQSSGFIFK